MPFYFSNQSTCSTLLFLPTCPISLFQSTKLLTCLPNFILPTCLPTYLTIILINLPLHFIILIYLLAPLYYSYLPLYYLCLPSKPPHFIIPVYLPTCLKLLFLSTCPTSLFRSISLPNFLCLSTYLAVPLYYSNLLTYASHFIIPTYLPTYLSHFIPNYSYFQAYANTYCDLC